MSSSTPREQRAARVSQALAEHSAGKRRHLPIVQRQDALAVTAVLHAALDAAALRREAEIRRDGATLACRAGCSSCCHTAVMVHDPEAMRVAEHLQRPEQAEARAHFLAAYPAWQQELGKDVERIRTLHAMGRVEDAERVFFRLQARRVMCAFNRDGLCSIYEVRPGICRNTHALDTAAHCTPGGEHGPTVMGFAPMDALMTQLPLVTGTLQDALRRQEDTPPDALCSAVHRMLTAPPTEATTNATTEATTNATTEATTNATTEATTTSRNAACPCGSGAKYKHCCDFDR